MVIFNTRFQNLEHMKKYYHKYYNREYKTFFLQIEKQISEFFDLKKFMKRKTIIHF